MGTFFVWRYFILFVLETVNELYLRVKSVDGEGTVYSKTGTMIGYAGVCKFTKVLLGPNGDKNPLGAAFGQVIRRLTGENLPLMSLNCRAGSESLYASDGRHVTVIKLMRGERLMVESEDLLAFTDDCKYGSRVIAQGVISQKGFFTSILTALSDNACVAILTSGNPLILSSPCACDPDALVAWTGDDPGFKLVLSWRNIIQQNSGESYVFSWEYPGTKIVLQPCERKSGIGLGIDGGSREYRPSEQQGQSLANAAGSVVGAAATIGSLFKNGQQ